MRRLRLTPLRLAAAVVLGSAACTGVGYAASLGLATQQLHAWGQTLTKASCNQSSTTADDTYVSQQHAATVEGSPSIPSTLTVAGSTHSQADYAFITFSLSGCSLPTTAGADSSTLTLYVTSAGGDTISLYPVTSSWSSSTLNWNGVSSLTIGSTATTSFTPAAAGFYTVTVTADVDAAIKAGALYGWELRDTTTSGTATTSIASSTYTTSADRPSLALSYEK